jgi:predicted RNA binding protein YcfA (HicA-like mRNA interferase family)
MSRRLAAVKPREVLRALRKAGFFIHHTSGSHHVLKHPGNPHLRVTVPFHNKELKPRALASIIEQSGLTTEEFSDLLSTIYVTLSPKYRDSGG